MCVRRLNTGIMSNGAHNSPDMKELIQQKANQEMWSARGSEIIESPAIVAMEVLSVRIAK